MFSTRKFIFSACLRLAGIGHRHAEISQRTGLVPSRVHLKGDPWGPASKRSRQEDLWLLDSPLGDAASLDEHLQWLWRAVEPHGADFQSWVAETTRADVCLGCFSESPYPMFSTAPESLTIVRELRLGLSFNFTCV